MLKFSLTLASALTVASQVGATSLTVQETLGAFGVVTQSFSGGSESEGRVFIQGDSSGTVNVTVRESNRALADFDDVIITGNVTGGSIRTNNGNVTIGGSVNNTQLTLNNTDTLTLGGTLGSSNQFNQNQTQVLENQANLIIPDIDFNAFEAESDFLASLDGVTVDTSDRNNIVFGGSSVVETSIFALSSGTASFDLTDLDTLIVNVSGTSGTIGTNFGSNSGFNPLDAGTSVVFNFFEAESVTFGTSVFGHILAPTATITLNSSNEGSIISESLFVNGGEAHPLDFTGTIPLNNSPISGPASSPAPVPLPASLPLALLGMGMFAALRRRKRA